MHGGPGPQKNWRLQDGLLQKQPWPPIEAYLSIVANVEQKWGGREAVSGRGAMEVDFLRQN